MNSNNSSSMKVLSSNQKTTPNLSREEIKRKKLFKLRYHGKIILVPYKEFLSLRKMNREKMKALKDSLVQIIKNKKEIYSQHNTYDIESLKKISVERESEYRNIIFHLQEEIRKDKNSYSKDMLDIYQNIISIIRNIYETTNKEIEERVNTITNKININIANCEYKQNKMLNKKIDENEIYFRCMQISINQMRKVMDNFNAVNKKILEFKENNYNYKKNLLKEKIQNDYLKHLMKKIKISIKNSNNLLSELNTNTNPQTIQNSQNLRVNNTIFASRQNNSKSNKTLPSNLKSFSIQKKLKINKSSTKNEDLLVIEESPNSKIKKRPFSSGHRLLTFDKNSNSTKRTNYSNSNTLQSNFRIHSSKGRPVDFKANSHKNLLNIKNNILTKNYSSKISKTNPNSYFFSSETEENKSYTKSEWNSIFLINKEINNLKNKQKEIINKINEELPDNEIYNSIAKIVENLRNDKDNKVVEGINNKYMKNYMKAIPLQDKAFREKFMDILFNDRNIYEAIKKVTKNNRNLLFNKNIFGAEKITKNKNNFYSII